MTDNTSSSSSGSMQRYVFPGGVLLVFLLVVFAFRKHISKVFSFLGESAHAFAQEYNDVYTEDNEEDTDDVVKTSSTNNSKKSKKQ